MLARQVEQQLASRQMTGHHQELAMSQTDVPQGQVNRDFVITLTREIDIADRAELWDRVDYGISTRPARVVIDLAGVTFMGSTALGALIHAKHQCTAKGIHLALRAPSRQVRRLLDITGTTEVFAIEP
jgi:anti-sigma B factor antagonist